MTVPVNDKPRSFEERLRNITTTLPLEIVEARRKAGFSKTQLARLLATNPSAISRLERGAGSVATLTDVMDALGFQLAGIAQGDTLGAQLANGRLKRNLSVMEAAAKAGLTGAAVEELEQGFGPLRNLFRFLAVIAPGVRARAPERAYWGQGDKVDRDSRFTPADFMKSVYEAFGEVDLDPCAHPMSPVVATRRIMPAEGGDGLAEDWSGRLAFVNPPFSKQLDWLKRAHEHWSAGRVQTVVFLAPVRTDNRFFHETLHKDADLFLLRGRLRFSSVRGDAQHTPFSLWLVVLGASAEQRARFAQLVDGRWFRASEQMAEEPCRLLRVG